MKVKRIISVFTVIAMLMCMFALTCSAAENTEKVYVTVANGVLELVQAEVKVSDVDGDNAITINDALYCAHEQYFDGGAEAGYATSKTQWGLSLMKLWGVSNGGSYGYYVNNTSAWSLTDTVNDGDHIDAFIYQDTKKFTDKYCYFDSYTMTQVRGKEVTVTLSAQGYDEEWNPITVPVKNAVITVNGEATEYVTDNEGKVTMSFARYGKYVLSAQSESELLVPPSCIVEVESSYAFINFFLRLFNYIKALLNIG